MPMSEVCMGGQESVNVAVLNSSVHHALNCPKGAFPTIRHNKLRDLTGNLLAEVCCYVCIELVLQTLGDETFNHFVCNSRGSCKIGHHAEQEDSGD